MKYHLYAIRDALTGFMQPVMEQNDAAARRNFEHAVFNPNSLMQSHKQHYDLYRVGDYDLDSGVIVPEIPAVMVCAGSSVEV